MTQPNTVSAETERRVRGLQGHGTPLSGSERAFFEPHFGRSFADVRVHEGPQADAATRAVDARAFALGSDVVFAEGARRPEIMAHELAHVARHPLGVIRRYGGSDDANKHPCSEPATSPPSGFCDDMAEWLARLDRLNRGASVLAGVYAASGFSSLAFEYYRKFIWNGSDKFEDASSGASDFTEHDATKFVTGKMITDVLNDLTAQRQSVFTAFETTPEAHIDQPVSAAQQRGVDTQSSDYALKFCGFNLPGIIAGGIGKTQTGNDNFGADKSQARNDFRNAQGSFRVTAQIVNPDQMALTVTPNVTFHVIDTVDFCPGNPGGFFAQTLTIPLSRWEASGISGDVTFGLDFPAPQMTGTITLERVNGVVRARDASVITP